MAADDAIDIKDGFEQFLTDNSNCGHLCRTNPL